jgi:molecular chaperone Hsp33
MTLTTRIAWDDTVLPFQLDRSDIRGRVARLDTTLEQILEQHDYPPEVEALVAEMALLTAMIGQTIKLRWKLSLQVRGDGPIRLIATDFFAPREDGAPARIRAFASYDAERLVSGADPFPQTGKGYFAILIDQGKGTAPYQGITPLSGGSLTSCAETYFAQSEQLPTRFTVGFGQSREPGEPMSNWRAGGVMLQHMPKVGAARPGRGRIGRGRAVVGRGPDRRATRARTGAAPTCCSTRSTSWSLSARACRPRTSSGAPVPRGNAARLRCAAGAVRLHLFGGSRAREPVDLFGQGYRAHDDR